MNEELKPCWCGELPDLMHYTEMGKRTYPIYAIKRLTSIYLTPSWRMMLNRKRRHAKIGIG